MFVSLLVIIAALSEPALGAGLKRLFQNINISSVTLSVGRPSSASAAAVGRHHGAESVNCVSAPQPLPLPSKQAHCRQYAWGGVDTQRNIAADAMEVEAEAADCGVQICSEKLVEFLRCGDMDGAGSIASLFPGGIRVSQPDPDIVRLWSALHGAPGNMGWQDRVAADTTRLQGLDGNDFIIGVEASASSSASSPPGAAETQFLLVRLLFALQMLARDVTWNVAKEMSTAKHEERERQGWGSGILGSLTYFHYRSAFLRVDRPSCPAELASQASSALQKKLHTSTPEELAILLESLCKSDPVCAAAFKLVAGSVGDDSKETPLLFAAAALADVRAGKLQTLIDAKITLRTA